MHVGVLTTSWPSVRAPWAGHFVADQALWLARSGCRVEVVAPSWRDAGGLLNRPGVVVHPVPFRGRTLGSPLRRGLPILSRLRRYARRVRSDVFLCHWWPTALAAPSGIPRLIVLHGSDVDLLQKMPLLVRRRLATERVVAVAPHLAQRFGHLTGASGAHLASLGARVGCSEGPRPSGSDAWFESPLPRVLTVARASPGKGLDRVYRAQRVLPEISWLVLGAERSASPEQVRTAMTWCDLLVVPSVDRPGLPREGRPHVILQAMVAGSPVLGGPNRAVVDALSSFGQPQLVDEDLRTMSVGVSAAIQPARHKLLSARASRAGRDLHWDAVVNEWRS